MASLLFHCARIPTPETDVPNPPIDVQSTMDAADRPIPPDGVVADRPTPFDALDAFDAVGLEDVDVPGLDVPSVDVPNMGFDTGVCPAGLNVCSNQCVDLQGDNNNCGSCGNACAAPLACVRGTCQCPGGDVLCGRSCVSLSIDRANCGACGVVCSMTQSCLTGTCSCRPGLSVCGAAACTNLQADANNCGACGVACAPGQLCIDGVCGMQCNAPNTVCGGGCVNTNTDRFNCGGCGMACGIGASCQNGRCSCAAGELLCDGRCVDRQTDNANCGACGNDCTAGRTCVGGSCQCPGGGTVCSGSCVSLASDRTNCGACGNACGVAQTCEMGTCQCGAGLSACGVGAARTCVNFQSDASNCGACGVACPAGQFCSAGVCRAQCDPTKTVCAGGCVNANTDRNNCGGCGTVCAVGASCQGGSCTCAAGFSVCDGRCVDRAADSNHCGACGNACGVGFSCRAGVCALNCAAPLVSCGGAGMMSCVDRQTDRNNCGACGTVCPGGLVCSAGTCRCPNGGTLCNGACVNTAVERNNCGACGAVCGIDQNCVAGACRCGAGLTACGAGAATSCVNAQSDSNNCGACGTRCAAGQFCRAGVCQVSCAAPNLVCGGACVDPSIDLDHCGACGNRCRAGTNCVAGACVPLNDRPEFPRVLDTTIGTRTSVSVNNSTATDDANACPSVGRTVYFSLTLAQRTLVYLDTFGSTVNTRIGVRQGAGGITRLCTGDACGTTNDVFIDELGAGTWLIELGSIGAGGAMQFNYSLAQVGRNVGVQLAPVANVTRENVGQTTAGGGFMTPDCGLGGNAAEDMYYFARCPSDPATTLHLSTCGALFDTVIQTRSSNGSRSCAPAAYGACGRGSSFTVDIAAGAGLHAIYVDSATSTYGQYRLKYTLASCNPGFELCNGFCVDVGSYMSDSSRCGSCGNACLAGTTCQRGFCGPPPQNTFPAFEASIGRSPPFGSLRGSLTTDVCPEPYRLTGLAVTTTSRDSDAVISSVAGICKKVELSGSRELVTTSRSPSTLPARGTVLALNSFELNCPEGYSVLGLTGRADTYVNALGLVCGKSAFMGAGPYTVTVGLGAESWILGGTGGSFTGANSCPAGSVASGLATRADVAVNQIGLTCSRPRVFAAQFTPAATTALPFIGGPGGMPYTQDCPANQLLVGATILADNGGNWWNRVAAICAPFDGFYGVNPSWNFLMGNPETLPELGTNMGTRQTAQCIGGTFVTGEIGLRADVLVDRAQLDCATIGTNGMGVTSIAPGYFTGALGGAGGIVNSDRSCPAGTVATGITGRASGSIDAFAVRCTPITIR